jgi:hypothetical protein
MDLERGATSGVVVSLGTRRFRVSNLPASVYSFLPVSDDAWFSGEPVASAMIDPKILQCWESLRDCSNQDERAWFLLSNYIMVQAHDLGQQRIINPQNVKDIEYAVTCFSLLLPDKFHLGSGHLLFDERNYRKSNWIILTQLFVQAWVQSQ